MLFNSKIVYFSKYLEKPITRKKTERVLICIGTRVRRSTSLLLLN